METTPIKINVLSAFYLIVKYPNLAVFIETCYNNGEHEELIDFLFALETDYVKYDN